MPGDDVAGSGGVVWYSASRQSHEHGLQSGYPPIPRPSKACIIVLVVKRARRGVGKRGLQCTLLLAGGFVEIHNNDMRAGAYLASLSMRKFCDKSAARLAVGEEPLTPLTLK